jgi:hypothetical protein
MKKHNVMIIPVFIISSNVANQSFARLRANTLHLVVSTAVLCVGLLSLLVIHSYDRMRHGVADDAVGFNTTA